MISAGGGRHTDAHGVKKLPTGHQRRSRGRGRFPLSLAFKAFSCADGEKVQVNDNALIKFSQAECKITANAAHQPVRARFSSYLQLAWRGAAAALGTHSVLQARRSEPSRRVRQC
jgi:hypothetical protein